VVGALGGIFYEPSNFFAEEGGEAAGVVAALDGLPIKDRLSMGEFFVPRSSHVLFAVQQAALDRVRGVHVIC
jgi:hypothetical protein